MSCAETLTLAKTKLAQGKLTPADLDALVASVASAASASCGSGKQWILYIHAAHPSIHAETLSATLHEPAPDKVPQLDPLAKPIPYKSVHEAIRDGWRVIHFPNQRDAFDDREIDVVGYEFILEKLQPPA
ncbi:MAG: hypothetical protein NTW19_24345 [Planctomycetota bacterium]|nr:hypothetical protein [Planctomycetota bacterium]